MLVQLPFREMGGGLLTWMSRSTEYSGAKSTSQQPRQTSITTTHVDGPPFPSKQGNASEEPSPGPRSFQ